MIVIAATIWSNRSVLLGLGSVVTPKYTEQPNEWQVYKAIEPNDTDHVYRVTWTQKYGATQVAYCKVVFRNDKEKQYKLVAPWLAGLDIERANMDDIQFEKVPMKDIPDGALGGE